MRLFFLICFSLILSGGITSDSHAHGVAYSMSEKTPIALDFFYSTGEPMSFSKADIFAPENPLGAFQSGRTDAKGRFAFTPYVDGEWRVVVDDGEGHRVDTIVTVSKGDDESESLPAAALQKSGPSGASETFRNALLGVSLIFNIAAAVSLYLAKRRQNHAHK